MTYPTSFEAKDFRWAEPVTGTKRTLLYVGFGRVIKIAMFSVQDGAYALGPITEPQLPRAAEEAFARCGGLRGLGDAALWFANSR